MCNILVLVRVLLKFHVIIHTNVKLGTTKFNNLIKIEVDFDLIKQNQSKRKIQKLSEPSANKNFANFAKNKFLP